MTWVTRVAPTVGPSVPELEHHVPPKALAQEPRGNLKMGSLNGIIFCNGPYSRLHVCGTVGPSCSNALSGPEWLDVLPTDACISWADSVLLFKSRDCR